MLPRLVPVLFAFYIQDVVTFKCQIPVKKIKAFETETRDDWCKASLTGCVGLNLVLRLHIVLAHAGMSGHVLLGAGKMHMMTGAIRSTPIAALEVLLDLNPLDLLIMAEASLTFYRLHIPKQTATSGIAAGLSFVWKSVGDPILETRSDYTVPVYSGPLTYELNSLPMADRNLSWS
jgi:hypothetical protein